MGYWDDGGRRERGAHGRRAARRNRPRVQVPQCESAHKTHAERVMFPVVAALAADPALRAELAHGLSDASRQRMLDLLCGGERRVSDIVEMTGLSQPNVSKHLRCLRGCGLVVSEKRGREVFYAVTDGLDEVLEALDVLLGRVAPQIVACELTSSTLESCP